MGNTADSNRAPVPAGGGPGGAPHVVAVGVVSDNPPASHNGSQATPRAHQDSILGPVTIYGVFDAPDFEWPYKGVWVGCGAGAIEVRRDVPAQSVPPDVVVR